MNTTTDYARLYKIRFNGSEQFYLADPTKVTIKKNGGERWAVKKEFYLDLDKCIQGHLDGSLNKGVVLPPIRKADNCCIWAAIDVDGEVYNNDQIKIDLLKKVKELKLPLVPCYSKSKGLHLYIFFNKWTDAKTVRDILYTFLYKLGLPKDTECFPKQIELSEDETGNGIMLPYMNGKGNDWIKSFNEKKIFTGDIFEFELATGLNAVDAEDIEIELPKPEKKKDDYETDNGLSKWEILKGIKNKTIEQHPTMGGKYHSWIQVVIAKAVKGDWGDNEILKLIKEVHQDNRGIGYVWPESYQKQINYARRENRLNKPNPGDTKFLEKQNLETASKLEEIKKTYCYVMANDMYNKLGSGEFYQATQINNYHAHQVFIEKGTLTNKLLNSKNFAKAETFITSAKYKPGLIYVKGPNEIPLVQKGIVLNIYIPNYVQPKKGDIQFILDFFIWLVGQDKWKIIEQWIAYNIQEPGIKIKWALVLVSEVEGVGKGLLARILSRILGYENVNENANYKHLTNTHNTLLIGTQVLVLNEVSLGDFKSKAEGTNTLKNFVADPFYTCNFKGRPMTKLPNLTNFMLFSNDPRVLSVNDGARRYYFCNIKKAEEEIIQKTNEGFFDKAWNFVDSDEGAAALLNYFLNEVKIEDPTIFQKRAPQTNDLKELIEQSKHPVIKKLEYDLNRPEEIHKKIFRTFSGLITFNELNDKMHTTDLDSLTKERYDWGSFGDDALYKFLSSNCTPWNNGEATRQIEIDGVRQRFYLLKDNCPIPGKSYKDLTPKQIETIYKNYLECFNKINNEEKNYKNAIVEEPERVETVLNIIKNDFGKKYKGRDPDEVFEKLMTGEEELPHNDQFVVKQIIKDRKIMDRGIRTPEQIIEDIRNNEE
jgi:hypothetical protein